MRTFFLTATLLWSVAVVAQAQDHLVERSTRVVRVDGRGYMLHPVARKQTLYSIAKAYQTSVEAIEQSNPYLGERLKVGMTLLIPIQEQGGEPATTPTTAPIPKEFIPAPAPTAAPLVPMEQPVVAADTLRVSEYMPSQVGQIRRSNNPGRGIEVGLLLPLGSGANEANFVDFLCGALLATDALKEAGVEVRLDVHSTEAQPAKARELITSGVLEDAQVLVGPVYDAPFEVVGAWATERRIPIISPLGGSGSLNNPYVVCAAPSEATKYDALRTALSDPAAKVSYIDCGASNDREWAEAATQLMPVGTSTLIYQGKETNVQELTELLTLTGRNVIILPSSDETLAEAILSRLSSINAVGRYNITVIGTPRWARFASMNLDLFFKLNVSYTTSYHADRNDKRVAEFFERYINAFGTVPSAYAMRGYDVIRWVGRAMHESGERFLYDLPSIEGTVLQTPYRFQQLGGPGSKFENARWAWVTYRPNYTIEVQ